MSLARDIADLGSSATRTAGSNNKNLIINGGMQVAQRGTSSSGLGTADGYFTLDRFLMNVGATSAGRFTMSQSTVTDLAGFANALKLECTTADTSIAAGEQLTIDHRIEGQDLQQFKKGTSEAESFTVSFYAKANANATYACELYDVDNTRQITKLFNVTSSWTRIILTFPPDTSGAFDDDNALSLNLIIGLHGGSTYTSGTLNSTAWASVVTANRRGGITSFFDSTSRTLEITGLQMEVGTTATDFEHRSYGDELARCRRYFNYIRHGGVANNAGLSNSYGNFLPQEPMRNTPTATAVGNDPLVAANFTAYPSGASVTPIINVQWESENGNVNVRPYVNLNNTYTYIEGFMSLDAEL
ncbi:MAG: hypothetical protein CM1200mV1_210 [uncultured marine virus]|nr:MAG: hypothetical protein CM1200mV1_210 [uncultured marine virus]